MPFSRSYNATFLKSLRVIPQNTQLVQYGHQVRNKFKRLIKKYHGTTTKHRAGWQVGLRRCPTNKTQIPLILSSNIQSLLGKIDNLNTVTQQKEYKNLKIIMLQESWLHKDIEDGIVSLDDFFAYRTDRPVKAQNRGGGVITYINQDWCKSPSKVYEYFTTKINCHIIECKPRFLSGFRSIIIANIYLAPRLLSHELKTFTDSLSSALITKIDSSLCIVAGDFNRFDTSFLTIIGLSNIVQFSTRCDAQLDFVFTNNTEIFSVKKRAPISNSDHCVIKVCPIIYGKTKTYMFPNKLSQTVKQRNCSLENIEKLKSMVAMTDFSVFFNQNHSIFCEHLTDYLNFCYDQCCPVEKLYLRTDRFSSPLLKRLRRKKENAYKEGCRSQVKFLSGLIRDEIKRLNKLYVDTILGNKNCRDIWKALKRLCGAASNRKAHDLNVEQLNSEFSSSMHSDCLPVFNSSHPPTPLKHDAVYTQLRKIKANKAAGPDNLSPVVLKECAEFLAGPLTNIFNDCLITGRIPDVWRTARLTPIPKKEPGKYRPIACTSTMLKVFEKLLLPKIITRTEANDTRQFAYKSSRSTMDAAAYLVHSIASALDKRCKFVRLVFLDYKNAFGCLNRGLLIDLLSEKGTEESVCRVVCDYFTNRNQYTHFNGKNSSIVPINSGVLQGAILSPIFFSLYVEQLPIPSNFIGCKYADDVVFGCKHFDFLEYAEIQRSLKEIVDWSTSRSLTLNTSKCLDLSFSFLTGESYQILVDRIPSLTANNQTIPKASSVKYLGIVITNNLSWSTHVQETFCKVRKLSFYSLRLKLLSVSYKLIFKFVTACILPFWLYCSPVIFPGLLNKDYDLLSRSIKHISKCSGISRDKLVDFIVDKHFKACLKLSSKILTDHFHPLHNELSKAISTSCTRAKFKLMYSRTSSYHNSVLPYLSRFLVSPNTLTTDLRKRLLE